MRTSPYEGRLIRIRAREPEDEPLLYQWFNDPEVTEHLALRYPLSHRTEREFIEHVSDVGFANANFAIETLDGRMIGGCSLENAVVQQVGVERDVFGIMAHGRCLGVVRVGLGIENHATTTGFVQNKLHALAGSKLGNAMQIGDHSGVPASNGSFEMCRHCCPNGWGLALE